MYIQTPQFNNLDRALCTDNLLIHFWATLVFGLLRMIPLFIHFKQHFIHGVLNP